MVNRETFDIRSPMDDLWKIFLNTQVVNASNSMIIRLYFHYEQLDEFLQRLMTSMMDCLTELAGVSPETSYTDVIEKLYIQIQGTWWRFDDSFVALLKCGTSTDWQRIALEETQI